MVDVRIKYDPKKKEWIRLQKGVQEYNEVEVNGYKVVTMNELLFLKVMNIIKIRKKGWDAIILIDGKRRSGKSTLGKTIAYVLDPTLSIKNFVAGVEDAPRALEEAREEGTIIFDEGSLTFNSKDSMKKTTGQLLKVIDVIGQKKLSMILCMPTFFDLNRSIALNHSLFLIHVYPDSNLKRGNFAYFSTKRKKTLYEIGKKNFSSYSKPKANFTGKFVDFTLDFEEEYNRLKMQSLKEALDTSPKKCVALQKSEYKTELMVEFKENCPDISNPIIAKGFGMSKRELYRRFALAKSVRGEQ